MSFRPYVEHGWKLCRIKAGEKGPRYTGWNRPGREVTAVEAEHIPSAGLLHAYSGTCALDIDDLDRTRAYLAQHGIDLDSIIQAPDSVGISSGTPNRAKLLFALPTPLPTKKVLSDDKVTLFELRCADAQGALSVQDVLPPSVHPSGRVYEWRYGDELTGSWQNLPPLPKALETLWRSLLPQSTASPDNPPAAPKEPANDSRIAEAQRILDATDPDCDYDTWIKLGMALEHELGADGWDLWNNWSAKGKKYPGAASLESHWNSFGRSPTPITLGTFKRQLVASKDDFEDLTNVDLDDPFEAAARERAAAIKLWTLQEIQQRPWPEWIIRDILPRAELSMVYGPSGAGKSFVVLDMALAVARGAPWWGHDVRRGGVLWLAAEAFGSMKPRTKAYAQANEIDINAIDNFRVVEQFNLNSPETVTALIEAVKGLSLSLVVVDTLAAASGGANENSGEDMGAILDACRRIHYATNASVLLIHHSGKNIELGARGWSGIRAAVQAELRVDYDPEQNTRCLTATKQRDGEDGVSFNFTLVPVVVGMDDRDQPISSAHVKLLGKRERAPAVEGDGGGKRPPKGANEAILWREYLKLQPLDGGPVQRAVLMDQVARAIGDADSMPQVKNRLRRALANLDSQGYLRLAGELIYPAEVEDTSEDAEDVGDLI